MRPQTSVNTNRKATTAKFKASIASKACSFGIHENQWSAVPVKSTNSHVMPINITVASVIRIVLSIKSVFV